MTVFDLKFVFLLVVLFACVSSDSPDKRDAGHFDSAESRERHGRNFGPRPRAHRLRPTSSGFTHFSPPRPRHPVHLTHEIPTSQFSIFAAAPHHLPSSFIGSHGHQSQVFPATLTHVHENQPVVHSPPRVHRPSHRGPPGHRFSPAPSNPFLHPNQSPVVPREFSGCPSYLECHPITACAPFYDFLIRQPNSKCSLPGGDAGVCCPSVNQPRARSRFFQSQNPRVPIRSFSLDEINDAAREGLFELKRRDEFDLTLQRNNIIINNRQRPEFGHLKFFRTTSAARGIGRNALKVVLTSDALARRFQLNAQEAGFGLEEFNTQNSIIDDSCPPPVICSRKDDFYRTADGSCNNQKIPHQGSSRTAFSRILPPQYENGIESPRTLSRVGVKLPSARVVSISNIVDADRPSPKFSLSVMQWGQFIDHDLTHAPMASFESDDGIECCNEKGQFIPASFKHPGCFPIDIPADDPFFQQYGRRCMNFVRSQIAPKPNCTFGTEEQMNQVTHFLDGSAVYGSSEDEERHLRLFQGGLLKTQGNGKLLPPDTNTTAEDCDLVGTGRQCFLAGDNRVFEQPDLTVVHTLMVRQHNKIARELGHLNPHWSDETIYQETRRIVVAEIQHITYNEWLPLIVGTDFALEAGLLPLKDGFSKDYDPSLDSRILNEFATVAFRFGHTLVDGMIDLFDKYHRKTETVTLHENFNSARLIYVPGKLEEFLRGLSKQPMQSFDNFVSESLTNRLFQTRTMPFGMDLIALNIQRGRDHAVATYNELREACGLGRARRFEDFPDLSDSVIKRFKILYPTVDDIDPFIGGISERPAPGAVVGPLFRCIITRQFQRLRQGDRFFYDNGGMRSSFTEAQLHEIRMTSWSRLVCDNGMHIKEIQPLSFRLAGPLNEKTSCSSSSIPSLDLTAWTAQRHK